MASYWSEYLATAFHNHLFDTSEAALARPDDIRISLHTASPGSTGGFTSEVSTGDWTNYAPAAVNNDGSTSQPVWNGPVAGGTGIRVDNLGQILFSSAATISSSTASVVVTHFALADYSSTGGRTLLFYGNLSGNFTVLNGQPVRFNTGVFDIDLTTT